MRPYFPLLTIILASACTMSNVDPDAVIELKGTTHDDLGQPLANQRIALVREPDIGEVLGGIIFGPVTVLACLGDSPPPICQDALIDNTNAAGEFSFTLLGRDTQGSIGNASYFTLATSMPASQGQSEGPSTYQRFQIQSEELTLPPMQLWTERLAIESTSESMRVSAEYTESFDLRFETGAAWGAPIWEVREYAGEALDARLFEDTEFTVVATQREETYIEGSSVESVARSAAYDATGSAGAPPSRGSSCSVADHEGSLLALSPCPMTDGNLGESYPLLDDGCDDEDEDEGDCSDSLANREAIIDLGEVSSAQFLVLRLGYYETQVQVSEDGQTWSMVGSGSGDTQFDLPAQTKLRYLRLSTLGPIASLVGLSEVSIW